MDNNITSIDIKNSRILIVDDNLKNIQVLGSILKKHGFIINVAQNGLDSIKIIDRAQPDLILMDIFMPELNGFETCKMIKENPLTKDIPIIFLTALTDDESKIKGFEIGGVDYITKPFNHLELIARIETHLKLIYTQKELKKQNASLIDANLKLELLAKTDPLTGILNRRYMYEKIEEEKIRYKRNQEPFSLVICDIDFFKKFNDTYGHLCGDFVLKSLTSFFKANIREQDYLARWGGEEFLLLFPDTSLEDGVKICEKLRTSIENKEFLYEENKLKITLTFGISEYIGEAVIDELIDIADKALYKGKNSGRNCVISF